MVRIEVTTRPDALGRQSFTEFWPASNIGPHCDEIGERGQVSFGVVADAVDRWGAAGPRGRRHRPSLVRGRSVMARLAPFAGTARATKLVAGGRVLSARPPAPCGTLASAVQALVAAGPNPTPPRGSGPAATSVQAACVSGLGRPTTTGAPPLAYPFRGWRGTASEGGARRGLPVLHPNRRTPTPSRSNAGAGVPD